MMSLGDIAANLPWPVFACGNDKRPIVATGFKAASRDPDIIRAQFNRPGATMIGMPTGAASGYIVIDIDIKSGRDGRAWLKDNALPTTRTHHTQSGGLHLVFLVPNGPEIRNSASKIAPGVDVRGEGGYVIIPPSPGYTIVDNVKIAEMPAWLIRACTYTKPPPPPPNGHTGPRERYTKYTQAAIDGELRAVTSASEGTRNDALNRAAFSLGTLVGAGQMSRSEAEMLLQQAGQEAGLRPLECVKTIKSGLDSGEQHPREMPEQRARAPHEQRANGHEKPKDAGDTPGTCPDGPPTIPFSTFADVQDAEDVNDFIENLLVMGAMSVIYGQSNCGKSFFALALAMCVAAGVPWRGQAVERGAVLYLALEGGKQAISNRLVAIKQHEGWEGYDLPFAFISVSVNLRNPSADVQPLIDTVAAVSHRFAEAECPVRLIVVDTLSRAMAGGNENSSEDMGALVINCDRIRERTCAHLALLHHSGKDEAKGARGHSNLQGATDTEIEIIDRDGTRTVTVTKQRDLPTLEPFAFTLKCVEIGTNRRGKPITTCLVEYDGVPTKRTNKAEKQPTHAQRALEILLDLCAAEGLKGFAGAPPDFATVPADWWRDRFYQRAMPGEDTDTKKHAFARASKTLIGQHKVGMAHNRVWITYPETQA